MKSLTRATGRVYRSPRLPLSNRLFCRRAFTRSALRQYASEAHLSGDLKFGQPLHESHPHLIKAGELTPGITALEYFERRMRLAKALPPDSVAILAASDIKTRSGAVFFKFHQEPNFFYLTGFNEPEAIAVVQKRGAGSDHTFYLFVRPKDPQKEKWEGSRSGVEAAREIFNADAAADISSLTTRLPRILSDATNVYTDISTRNSESSSPIAKMIFGGAAPSARRLSELLATSSIAPLRPILNSLRAFKSPAEIANLRLAGQKSGRGFTNAMSQKWELELQLEGFLEYQFKSLGCEQSAYVPVIAGGENANQIHYVRNDAELRDGQLVCADAGGEYGGYVADITRTWPVSGKFTAPQRDLYSMILDVQRECVSLCRENANLSLDQLHHYADRGLREGLKALGFDLSRGAMESLFPHHLGHYIGLDIHDGPGYPRTNPLKAGQCVTIEPGIYVSEDDERMPKHFRGMGIRIEDCVCVQEETNLILTTEAVKEVADIEALRA